MTPNKSTALSETKSFEQIHVMAREKATQKKPKAALVSPAHADIFKAFFLAIDDGLIDPAIVGERTMIEKAAAEVDFSLDGITIYDCSPDKSAVATACKMAADGKADIIIRGTFPTDQFIKELFEEETGFVERGKLANHVAVIEAERYQQLLLLTDAAVLVDPDLKQKISMVNNLIAVGNRIGIDTPRVAVLAAVEVVYPQMPATIDGAVLGKMSERNQIKGGFVDGPLSFDCAVDPVAAESKGITNSEVAGRANAMLAPNIDTAHGVYKAMALYGNARVGGVIYGGRVPVALAARSDSAENILNSIALAVLVG
ncbi:MAG: phosphate butyryltransferase [Candidatus Zixiibacteriota bacterium]|nr:MAG: phosphate butyryltransferase [candidate division Zixibacteria bacterium]